VPKRESDDYLWAVQMVQTLALPTACRDDALEVLHRLKKENTILRGIAATVMPCHYCGVDDIIRCPHGFPGCSLADDLMAVQCYVKAG